MSDTQTTGHYVAASARGADEGLIGAVLGSYRITSVLSAGGMGSVYRAQHELLDRPAAIKLLRPELTENDELVQRFFNEARAATAIRHPGIVEVYDFGYTDDGHAYLVMELIDGLPLSRALAERRRFSELEAAQIARNMASALKAAHAKGIVHRDLKPDNVFLVPDPDGREARVKVLDFGIAKLANPPTSDRRRTQTGVLMGTPKYMAPEQAREAGTIDHRADLYSLGCIVYELLCGEPPFIAEGAGEIIAMQLFNEPEPLGRRVDVSPEMEHLVMRLLAKEPRERPQTAHEVMDALVAIGARMSSSRDAISTDSRSGLRVSATTRALMDTIPSTPSAQLLAPPRATKRSLLPFVLAGLALAVAGGTVAFLLSRGEAPVAATPPPAPAVTTPPVVDQPVETRRVEAKPVDPPVAPPVEQPLAKPEAKKKPVTKTGGKNDAKVDVKTEPKPATKIETVTKPTTDNNSPIETDIGDGPRAPKAP